MNAKAAKQQAKARSPKNQPGPSRNKPSGPAYEWIDTAAGFDKFLTSLTGVDRIAVDTEFHSERTYWPALALVQIAAGERIVLIDPLKIDVSGLAEVITGDMVTVMHASEADLAMLYNACGAIPKQLVDVQIVAGFAGMSTPSLSSLVARFTENQISKGDRLTNWLKRPLTEAQCQYAANDVTFLFEITDRLFEKLRKNGRLKWALDECELARKEPPELIDPELAWFRIKPARQLRGQARAVVSQLAAWRELMARKQNIPPRFVVSDLAMVSIAQRSPKNTDDLKSVRGVQGQSLGKSNEAGVLDAVRRGLAMSPADVRTPELIDKQPLASNLRAAVSLITAWLSDVAYREHLDPTLLATRSDIELLLNDDNSSRLMTGWRSELIGETVTELLAGRAGIAFDKGKGLRAIKT